MKTISTVEKKIAQYGVAFTACTLPSNDGRLASRAIANATREDE